MIKERGLLNLCAVAFKARNICPFLLTEISELLAQPEQDKAGTVMPNGVCVSNVYDAYEEGRKSVMVKQEPVAWCQMVEGKVQDLLTSFEMKDWLYDKSWIPLYTSPPTREPLSTDTMLRLITEHRDFPLNLVRAIEKEHGIGGGNE